MKRKPVPFSRCLSFIKTPACWASGSGFIGYLKEKAAHDERISGCTAEQ